MARSAARILLRTPRLTMREFTASDFDDLLRLDSDPRVLTQGALRQASAEFRFRDYYALARATNLGQSFVLTEEYRALPD